jgi:glycosyltransferase involved in cell wall biosynthesis
MRIALITDGIWPYVLGGMQKHSYYVCKYLARQKVQVDLFHFNQSNFDIGKLEFFSPEELKYIRSQVIPFPKSLPFPGHYLYNSWRYSKQVYKAIGSQLTSYDFIYTKGFTGWYLIDQKAKRPELPPIGVKFHGYEMFQQPPDLKVKLQHLFLLRKPVRSISRRADVVFSYGGKITDIIHSIGVASEHIIELPSGVEQDMLAESIVPTGQDKVRFLFLGRYERRKGVEELNTAIRMILDQPAFLGAEFQFIGPIPEDKRIAHQQVVYHGEIRGREGLQALMRQCDVLICPSWSEGMPNVILEAMANGLAVAATDVGATNVLINQQTGWLLQTSNPQEIRETIALILTSGTAMLDRKKQAALDLIRNNFTWEKLGLRLVEQLKQRLAKNK